MNINIIYLNISNLSDACLKQHTKTDYSMNLITHRLNIELEIMDALIIG